MLGYDPSVSLPVPPGAVRSSRRALCALVALTLGLLCAVLVATMSTGSDDMASMSSMDGMGSTAVVSATSAAAGPQGAAGTATRPPAVLGPADGAVPVMSSVCDTACVNEVATTCALAAAAVIATLMVLLLAASLRDTFLGLLARTPLTDLARPRSARATSVALSRSTLCVWRV